MTKLSDIIEKIEQLNVENKRLMIAVSGPPASGKSTLAQRLGETLANSIVVPMDGFHLDNALLDEMGVREKKGAPYTFDADGFLELIKAIARDDGFIAVPQFDRALDAVIEGNIFVGNDHRVVIVEGNYLMLDSLPWLELEDYFDYTLSLNPGMEILRKRLIERWQSYGHSYEEAVARAQSNDIANAQYIETYAKRSQLELSAVDF